MYVHAKRRYWFDDYLRHPWYHFEGGKNSVNRLKLATLVVCMANTIEHRPLVLKSPRLLPHVALRLGFRVNETPMVDLGVGLRVVCHERPISTSRLAFHFRNTSALRLVIRSRRIARRSYWLVIRSLVRRKRRFLRGGVFVISSPITLPYSSVAGDVAIARVVVMVLVFCS